MLGDHRGVYFAFGQNLLMSILFVVMFFKRGKGLRGQSIFIAVFKMMGTGLTSLHFYLFESVSRSSLYCFLYLSRYCFLIFYMSSWWQIITRKMIYLCSRFEHLLYLYSNPNVYNCPCKIH